MLEKHGRRYADSATRLETAIRWLRGMDAGARRADEASRSGQCQDQALTGASRDSGRLLATFAREAGCILTQQWLSHLDPREGGNEHETFVDLSQPGWRIKITGPALALRVGRHRSWLSELAYLESMRLANLVFGDAAEFLGVIQTSAGSRLVIRQPEVEAEDVDNPHPTKREINDWLRSADFAYDEGAWLREEDGMLLEDEHEGNFIQTPFGPRPIDIHLRQLTGDFAPVIPWAKCSANPLWSASP